MARKAAKSVRRGKAKSKRAKARPARAAIRRAGTPRAAPPPTATIGRIHASAVPQPKGAKAANTIIYIHGIGNKPAASVLKCQWDMSLFGTRLGDRSRMAYWVNREYYPTPLDETCAAGDLVDVMAQEGGDTRVRALRAAGIPAAPADLDNDIRAITEDPVRRAWLARVAARLVAGTAVSEAEARTRNVHAKVLPLPAFLRQLISRSLTQTFLRDVHDFLFVAARRDAMEQSLIERLAAGGGPFVVIAHSQGTMIAYDVLRRLRREQHHVPLFVTMGSPLGLQEVQDVLLQWTGGRKLPFPPCVDTWVNVAERLDPVAFDADISNDFEGKIQNHGRIGINPDSPRHPHSATGYLRTEEVRRCVREVVGSAFHQSLVPFTVARDLVNDIEDGYAIDRHKVLIQLAPERPEKPESPVMLDEVAEKVRKLISDLIVASGDDPSVARMERLRHFMSAELTRFEVESLRTSYSDLQIAGIWRNATKRALIADSTHTVQVRPANLGYGADGTKMCWAVLDTGIKADHPHFAAHANVVAQWDCTARGDAKRIEAGSREFNDLDRNGHGTHVAGIIAGELTLDDGTTLAGMAPRCALYGFKVLNDQGEGDDSWIIKALDVIADLNAAAGSLVIQGINLSLGGNFDPSIFGCGHTPLCQELRRLWRQGVLVCLAAGNEGYAVLRSEDGDIQANLDLSIGDPANLDEAIAVGSVHKKNPHTYGISYFSSRGPTADGRRKPDVVAPGEKIISARHDWRRRRNGSMLDDLYVEMSGTSMATPHVSGLLASFLSRRREFVGYPDRVKTFLLASCIDLGRDPYMQGAGLPNLVKMLALN